MENWSLRHDGASAAQFCTQREDSGGGGGGGGGDGGGEGGRGGGEGGAAECRVDKKLKFYHQHRQEAKSSTRSATNMDRDDNAS